MSQKQKLLQGFALPLIQSDQQRKSFGFAEQSSTKVLPADSQTEIKM
jgi:hypothetical protein